MDMLLAKLAFLQKQRAEAEKQLNSVEVQNNVKGYLKAKINLSFFDHWIHELERGVQFK